MENKKVANIKLAKKKLIPTFDLFENSWQIYRANFKSLISISLYGLLGLAVIAVGVALISGLVVFLNVKGDGSLVMNIILGILIVLVAAATIALAIWYSTRSKIGTYLLIKNDFKSVKESWEDSKELFWPFFWLSLLVAVFVILWSFLLIIPGLVFAVFSSFAILLFIFNGQTGMKAIVASKALVKGYWWAVFGRFAFLFLVFYLFSLVLGLPNSFMEENSAPSNIWGMISSIGIFLVSPFLYVYSILLFKNITEVKNN
jgi:hypothetical protein